MIDNNQFEALHACIRNGGLKGGQLLLDRGMDFELYQQWKKECHLDTEGHDDTLQALAEHWAHRNDAPEQSCPRMEGTTLG